ncbi:hypothetical protein L1987_56697 [Smallanthus sonchifolius]|uniref:Uncharacterized protein n=1 Tax=Smallanthus sonchifolius TaxID=185202 RepID=A0ACB9EE50_9ASTR|nr:hypothetical protein L1987_56697 [Smallanthus sonchifolius]
MEGGSEKVNNKSGTGDVNEALKKCLEENKGDDGKCKPKIEALKSFPKKKKTPPPPLRLRSGSLTDV